MPVDSNPHFFNEWDMNAMDFPLMELSTMKVSGCSLSDLDLTTMRFQPVNLLTTLFALSKKIEHYPTHALRAANPCSSNHSAVTLMVLGWGLNLKSKMNSLSCCWSGNVFVGWPWTRS